MPNVKKTHLRALRKRGVSVAYVKAQLEAVVSGLGMRIVGTQIHNGRGYEITEEEACADGYFDTDFHRAMSLETRVGSFSSHPLDLRRVLPDLRKALDFARVERRSRSCFWVFFNRKNS